MMSWTRDELDKIGIAEELHLALRRNGTLLQPVTIRVVRVGDDLYVRSAYGLSSAWFREVQMRHEGRIQAGGVEKDVIFMGTDPSLSDEIDREYRTKYSRYGASYVKFVVSPEARAATIKPVPRSAKS